MDVDTLHGVQVADPYRWLEDEKAPEVQAWMKAQDEFTRAQLAKLPGRDALAARLRSCSTIDAISAPTHRKGRYFYTRKHADKEKTIVYWKQGEKGDGEGAVRSEHVERPTAPSALGGWWPSHDGKHVAYASRRTTPTRPR